MKSQLTIIGTYKGYDYMVVLQTAEIMQWYCGYVKLPSDHPYVKLTKKRSWFDWFDIGTSMWKLKKKVGKKPKSRRRYLYTGYDDMDIDVHGGLTFCQYFKEPKSIFPVGAWIGWDYAHAGDDMSMREKDVEPKNKQLYRDIQKIHDRYPMIYDKRWTTKEVKRDCKKVIDQLLKHE